MERPNIVLIFPDQWRADCVGYGGNEEIDTPYLDELATQSIVFDRFYSPCPTCIATRACMHTGLNPYHVGRTGYRDSVTWRYPVTLAGVLRNAGYATIAVGKTHFYPQRAHLGFEELVSYDTQLLDPFYMSDYHEWLALVAPTVQDPAMTSWTNSVFAQPWTAEESLHPNVWTANQACKKIEKRDPTRPFFLQVGFHRPHPPFDPPVNAYLRYQNRSIAEPARGDWVSLFPHTGPDTVSRKRIGKEALRQSRRAYYAQIQHLDTQIGSILHTLRKQRLQENTIVIFLSDHGEMLGDHGFFSKSKPFEGSARVPMMIHIPGSGHRRISFPCTHADLMPTLLSLASVSIPDRLDGINLEAQLSGEAVPTRSHIYTGHSDGDGGWQCVTDERFKYIVDTRSGKALLFDLLEDPKELHALEDETESRRMECLLMDELKAMEEYALVVNGHIRIGSAMPALRKALESP